MFNIHRVKPTAYKEYDVPKQDSRRGSLASEAQETKFICPLHGEIKDGNLVQSRRAERRGGLIARIFGFFGKCDLQQKLADHGIDVRMSRSVKRRVEQISKHSPLLVWEELNVLTIQKLFQLRAAMRNKIHALKCEVSSLQEEKLAKTTENKELRKKSKSLEEDLKKVLTPWVNRFPHSDDLTREFLIN